jgi:N-acyl-D-aspartate/D-glutamate deacylase
VFDLKIVGGRIVDGSGATPFEGDVAITDGTVVDVRPGPIDGEAAEVIDARGLIVTPGFVDVHTHYDGQATWDPVLEPSSAHGVTTVVMGNCGVGFAPVTPGSEGWLIGLMEGVEDIPGTALSEGMDWTWETFPEYLDALDRRRFSVDIGAQIAHGPVRAFAMGARGAANEPATPEDIEKMAELVREGIRAGALGFSTSRTLVHRAVDGQPVPGTFAAEDELFGIGRAMASAGRSVFELAPVGAAGEDIVAPKAEMDWMCRLAGEIEMPVSFALEQVHSAPDLWKEMMDRSIDAIDRGAPVYPQIAARPFGMLLGFPARHAFAGRPTFRALKGRCSWPELVEELKKPAIKQAILSEADVPTRGPAYMSQDASIPMPLNRLYPLGDPPDYEPPPEHTVAALAEAAGADAEGFVYELMLEYDAGHLLMVPFFNYSDGNHDAIREMLLHPAGVSGLGDGGAHCFLICDASIPTYMITHWARDRHRGPGLPLEYVVRKQTMDTARLFGLEDRGLLAKGKKADVNVIDFGALTLGMPYMAHDLPAGGSRLLQRATGYVATIVSGEVTRRAGVDTGARPGRLVRGPAR